MSKNLTGNKRIVKDACIDLYNATQKWIKLTSDSHSTVVSICTIRLKELSEVLSSYQELVEDNSSVSTVSPEMLLLCSELKMKLKNLELAVDKMKKTSKKLRTIDQLSTLESSHHKNDSDSFESGPNTDIILFQQWPLTRFCEASEEIEKMHLKELGWKQVIAKRLPISTDDLELTLSESSWKYESNIDRARVNELLEAILCELEMTP